MLNKRKSKAAPMAWVIGIFYVERYDPGASFTKMAALAQTCVEEADPTIVSILEARLGSQAMLGCVILQKIHEARVMLDQGVPEKAIIEELTFRVS